MATHTFCDGCEKKLSADDHYWIAVPNFLSAPKQHDFCFECFVKYVSGIIENSSRIVPLKKEGK